MLEYTIELDVTPGGPPQFVRVKQYQTDATLKFHLWSSKGSLSIGTVSDCAIRGTKTDGNGYSASASYNASDQCVTAHLADQMTAVAGKQPFELTLTDSTGKMITATFYLAVQRAAMDMDTLSASEIRELTDALEHTDEILEAYNLAHYDDVPTAGSSKAVKSGGIKAAIDAISITVTDPNSDGNIIMTY